METNQNTFLKSVHLRICFQTSGTMDFQLKAPNIIKLSYLCIYLCTNLYYLVSPVVFWSCLSRALETVPLFACWDQGLSKWLSSVPKDCLTFHRITVSQGTFCVRVQNPVGDILKEVSQQISQILPRYIPSQRTLSIPVAPA